MWAVFGILFSLGLPLEMPRAQEGPAMGFAAPRECLYYANWSGLGALDAASVNLTERLLGRGRAK